MESTGKPGRVHISQATKNFLSDQYILEPGDPVMGIYLFCILALTNLFIHDNLSCFILLYFFFVIIY